MSTQAGLDAARRTPLSRERVLQAAVALADERGIDALTMRNLGEALGVEAMSLYNHVANKEDLLNGIVDLVVGEILERVDALDPITTEAEWKAAMRRRLLAARDVLLLHPWAPSVIETRADLSPTLIGYFDGLIALFRAGGFSMDLTHHALHALGSRALGFTQELFNENDDDVDPEVAEIMFRQMAQDFPNIVEMLSVVRHDADTTLGWCDDQFEFEFGLDVILDGLEQRRDAE